MAEWIRISNGVLSAAIDPHGAQLSSLTDADGRELMTDADPRFWNGRAPILFPVVGAPSGETIRVDGVDYPMRKHGFARRSDFAVIEATPTRAVFALTDDPATRAHYPFAFRLELAYTLAGATLAIEATVANPADVPLPASFGFHPAFAWPLPYGHARADHRIVFAADEPGRLRSIAADGTIAAATVPSPLDGRVLRLDDALFAHDALVWDAVVSQSVRYGADAGPQLEITFPDTPKLGIWTKPGAAFVCVEPWHGIADPEGYIGEYRDKPGVFEVAPGSEKRITMGVALVK
ncbi:aldose 1-epimerase family protein [Sphingomonas sp. BK580]|uniref:aldose 1-epimerase family protein n=1 Tax=Sphingomonas sp. BK580 TaxID=2586972 RepID=UPI001610FDBA|nr:aldose 1-epimerase family protein [Sphingomonas sp. BK580]MBB3693699.1 galactose mutarotase-like enzyme [Sphingomonas sp. BK580]